ncbi:MAG: hypothetical protein ACK5JM_13485 [Rhodoblastus sp.]
MRLGIAILSTAIALGFVAGFAVEPAAAGHKYRKYKRTYQQTERQNDRCRPWCTFDMTPCDPPQYKVADGRCTSPIYGGGRFW